MTGNIYRSHYFGFSYTLPEPLEVDESFMQGQEDESKQAFLLLAAYGAAQGPGTREGVVISADRNTDPALKTGGDYLAKLSREFFLPKGFEVVGATREVTLGGHIFRRIDYRKAEVYQSVLVTLWRGFLLIFNLVAPTPEEVERLFASVESLKFAPVQAPAQRVPSAKPTAK